MSFDALGLSEPILRAVRDTGYTTPTPIQKAAIPPVLAGDDVMGTAQTGTGKTAAFTLPILHRMHESRGSASNDRSRPIRCLILSPTRELAAQIGESVGTYAKHVHLRHTVIFGGVGQGAQVSALRRGIDILVATPGRLLDLMQQRLVRLDQIEIFVLDEADRMLDMGFINDIRKVLRVIPQKRQTLFFSATMPSEIRSLAGEMLNKPISVEVAPVSATADTVDQHVYFVEKAFKTDLLEHILADQAIYRCIVFTRTKHGADKVAKVLEKGGVPSEAIHGNKSQNQRVRALESFRTGKARVMVASDIAARGLDIDNIDLVVNFDVPNEPETYVHRIGRTGRAGASGKAVSFCSSEERNYLRDIERLIRKPVPAIIDHPCAGRSSPPKPEGSAPDRRNGQGGGRGGNGGGQRGGNSQRGQRGGSGRGNSDARAAAAPRDRQSQPSERPQRTSEAAAAPARAERSDDRPRTNTRQAGVSFSSGEPRRRPQQRRPRA